MSMKEIAQRAGVSAATVSRVLNNPDHRCAKRDEILSIARELNYAPNAAARSLRKGVVDTQQTRFLSILVTRTDSAGVDPFFTRLVNSIQSEIHRNSCILTKILYRSLFSDDRTCSARDVQMTIDEMSSLDGNKPDGIIIMGKCAPFAIEQMRAHVPHIVSVNRNSTNYLVDEVHCDGRKIAHLAVERLVELGHEHLGYIGAVRNEARYEGFCDTLQAHGLIVDDDCVVEAAASEAEGFAAMARLIEGERRPSGIYCANDIIAVGALKYLWQHRNQGYAPSVIGSDDIEEGEFTKPMLTTIHLPREEMAHFALQLLLDRMDGGYTSVVKLEVEGTLKERCSCMPA